jgi:hypothetical protein
LLKVRHIYLKGRKYKMGDEKNTSFWMDQCLDDTPLCITYPILFYLCLKQNSYVHEVVSVGWVIKFKCHIQGVVREQWYELARKLNQVTLSQDSDHVIWKWSKTGKFTMKSVYDQIIKRDEGLRTTEYGKQSFLKKIKVFMWLVEQRAILTKDNMKKRNWQGDPDCYMCGQFESTNRLFFECPIAKVIWGVIALSFHQNDMPSNYNQLWPWLEKALPGGQAVYMLGLAAVCWAI